jgi:hypothetical protein
MMIIIIIVGFCVMENLLIMYSCIFKVLWQVMGVKWDYALSIFQDAV